MKYFIFGAGGHCRSLIDVLLQNDDVYCEDIIIFDDNFESTNVDIMKIKPSSICIKSTVDLLDFINRLSNETYDKIVFFCAIGDNNTRKLVVDKINAMTSYKFKWTNIMSQRSNISSFSLIDDGVVFMNFSNIGPNVIIGKHCIINNHANVDHDCELGDYVHIAPNACLCGNVIVGSYTLICSAACGKT
jgi:acetyltransferase EpsM